MDTPVLTVEELRRLFHYNPDTGVFTRIAHLNPARPGTGTLGVVGSLTGHGYLRICVRGREVLLHRAAWAYMTGVWPDFFVDHENGHRADNRWKNLRESNASLNAQNQKGPTARSKTNLLGVCRTNQPGRFKAQIGVKGKRVYLGWFYSEEAAHQAYLEAKRKLHPANTL